jgi:hypothetical protein
MSLGTESAGDKVVKVMDKQFYLLVILMGEVGNKEKTGVGKVISI